MDRSQKMATGIFFFIIVMIMLINSVSQAGRSIPGRVGSLYPLESSQSLATGNMKVYISNDPPLITADNLIKKLGRPANKANADQLTYNAAEPILLMYDDYVVSILSNGNGGSRVEITNHESAYNRHRGTYVHFWGPYVRRGSVFPMPGTGGGYGGGGSYNNGGGTGRVQGGGIGGFGGK